jgi:dTDP-L-rhamnose 4-epimerase
VVTGELRLGDVRRVVAWPARAELGVEAAVGFAEGVADFAVAPQREPVDRDGRRQL